MGGWGVRRGRGGELCVEVENNDWTFDDSERFLFLYFPRRSRPKAIEKFLLDKVESGLKVDDKTFVSFIFHVVTSDACIFSFRFLGVVEGGIKEGWVIFFQEDRKWTVERVLKMCGDLEKVFLESGPGKYMARLALSFSSTQPTIDVSPACYWICLFLNKSYI